MGNRQRLHRSELAVPGSNVRMLEKAAHADADVVFLDLEDAVAPDDKESARENVIAALLELDWSHCSVSVRINGLDTHWCYRDIVEVMERAGHRLDTLLVPKVGRASDLEFVVTLLSQLEAACRLPPLGVHALIETALGMANVEQIAAACPERMEALVFGGLMLLGGRLGDTIGRNQCLTDTDPKEGTETKSRPDWRPNRPTSH